MNSLESTTNLFRIERKQGMTLLSVRKRSEDIVRDNRVVGLNKRVRGHNKKCDRQLHRRDIPPPPGAHLIGGAEGSLFTHQLDRLSSRSYNSGNIVILTAPEKGISMKTLSLKLDDALYARVLAVAKQRGATQSDVVRDAILALLEPTRGKLVGSALDLAKDLAGSVTGPADLSSNKAHLRGFGR